MTDSPGGGNHLVPTRTVPEADGGAPLGGLPPGGTATPNLALAALIAGAAATAFNPVFVRLSDLDPTGSAFHRMAWALPIMVGWAVVETRAAPAPPAAAPLPLPARLRDLLLLGLCGLFFAGDLIALHFSIELTTVANAILFLNAQPIYVVLGAWLLFGERVRAKFLAAVAVAMVGAVVMLSESARFTGGRLLGDGLGVVAGVCYAGYILTASRLRMRFSSAAINAWTCLVACPVILVAAVAGGQTLVPGTPRDWALMIALGVVSQAGGQGFIVWALAHLSTSFSSVALLSAPVASAIFAWVILSESLTGVQLAGMAVVMGGIYMAHRFAGPAVPAEP